MIPGPHRRKGGALLLGATTPGAMGPYGRSWPPCPMDGEPGHPDDPERPAAEDGPGPDAVVHGEGGAGSG